MRYAIWAICLWMLVGLGLQTGAFKIAYDYASQAASVFFVDSSTPQSLHKAYAAAHKKNGEKFKVLVVPGHDSQYSGTSYGGLSEADLTLAAGKLLVGELAQDKNIEARLSRTDQGYDAELARYFAEHRNDILVYRAQQTALMQDYMATGDIVSNVIVDHNVAPSEVAIRLYGINKWANEQGYDLIIHIHFNDIPRAVRALPGPYTGFALYVPEHQFSNAKGSWAIAEAIKVRLLELSHVSTHPKENTSPTEDQELIAIGSNNSLDAASILVEYAYIYEQSVQNPYLRQGALEASARATYQGIEDFLKNNDTL